ncbi:putative cytochrome P450 4d14 [Haematobia irritans]|uniref:putative cytochrome P450 4d14 n=1 Tax=Haematobia irritans TaxID=7368 RepID=UPI003F4FABF3
MFLELIALLIILTLIFDYMVRKRINDIVRASDFPRGKYTLPIVGDSLPYLRLDIKDSLTFYNHVREKYGKVCRLWVFYRCVFFVQDVKFFEHILSSQTLISKSFYYDMLSSWLGNGLLLSSGSKWHKRRKIITPTFHFKILTQFVEIFDRHSRTMVNKLKAIADGKTSIDIYQAVCPAALDIIAESALGVGINAQHNADIAYIKALKSVAYITWYRFMNPLRYSDFNFMLLAPRYYLELHKNIRVMHAFTEKLIEERRATLKKSIEEGFNQPSNEEDEDNESVGMKQRLSFLDVLLQATVDDRYLTNADIREEVDTFTFEGHDTTTSGISNTLYLLSRHPEIQRKVFEEILNVMGSDKETSIRMKDLQELKYLECVIKESMRLYPPVPIIGREVKDDTKVGDQILPANSTISMSIYAIGRDPELFPYPNEFRPERFAGIQAEKTNPYAYVPFSAGPRNCIGQRFAMLEMKSIMTCVIRHYELLPLGPDFEPIVSLVLRSATGVNLGLKHRIY